jgi:hypothetical protein
MNRLAKVAAISALVGVAGLPFQSANGFWGGGPWDGYGWGGWGGPWGNPYYGGWGGGPWGYGGYPYGGWGGPWWGGYGGYPLVGAPLVLRPAAPAAKATEEPKEAQQESEKGASQ